MTVQILTNPFIQSIKPMNNCDWYWEKRNRAPTHGRMKIPRLSNEPMHASERLTYEVFSTNGEAVGYF